MKLDDFHYDLPATQIAQQPPAERRGSRLLALSREGTAPWRDASFADLPGLLAPGDCLVFNDTRVIPARLFGQKDSGGQVEVLVERLLDDRAALVQIRASKTPRPGSLLQFGPAGALQVRARREDGFFEVHAHGDASLAQLLEQAGHMPLPPYIERADQPADFERYQTVYARRPGAVAAPTAGLHFDEAMLAGLEARGIARAFVTLHVGAGTFQPVRVEDVREHRMHAEYLEVGPDTVAVINCTRAAGGRVVAVGTTSVRALETAAAANGGHLAPYGGDTRLFITPGYRFQVIDALVTNFHMPCSTLLMLVCAFGGHQRVMAAYRHAVAAGYRFFSYGDAMFLEQANR